MYSMGDLQYVRIYVQYVQYVSPQYKGYNVQNVRLTIQEPTEHRDIIIMVQIQMWLIVCVCVCVYVCWYIEM